MYIDGTCGESCSILVSHDVLCTLRISLHSLMAETVSVNKQVCAIYGRLW
jgi:hypothetical protein